MATIAQNYTAVGATCVDLFNVVPWDLSMLTRHALWSVVTSYFKSALRQRIHGTSWSEDPEHIFPHFLLVLCICMRKKERKKLRKKIEETRVKQRITTGCLNPKQKIMN